MAGPVSTGGRNAAFASYIQHAGFVINVGFQQSRRIH